MSGWSHVTPLLNWIKWYSMALNRPGDNHPISSTSAGPVTRDGRTVVLFPIFLFENFKQTSSIPTIVSIGRIEPCHFCCWFVCQKSVKEGLLVRECRQTWYSLILSGWADLTLWVGVLVALRLENPRFTHANPYILWLIYNSESAYKMPAPPNYVFTIFAFVAFFLCLIKFPSQFHGRSRRASCSSISL